MSGGLERWDPLSDPAAEPAAYTSAQRRILFNVRDRLQRAVICGSHTDVMERTNAEDPTVKTEPYSAAAAARHKVIHEKRIDPTETTMSQLERDSLAHAAESTEVITMDQGEEEISYASNTATATLLSRQYESLSRKDVMLEEAQQFQIITLNFFQSIRWTMQAAFDSEVRAMAAKTEENRLHEESQKSLIANEIVELENSSRRRMEALENDYSSRIAAEVSRAFDVMRGGQKFARQDWLTSQEERARQALVLEADRRISRILSVQLSEAQGIVVRSLINDAAPQKPTALAGGSGTRSTPRDPASPSAKSQQPETMTMPSVPAGAFLNDEFDRTSATDTTFSDEGEGRQFELMARFTPYWGWMVKSSGVLMTWQRRFFVFSQRGKLRYSTSEEGPWTTLLVAPNILRVEVDSYHDSSHGVRPPSDQYHQYGFYVDAADPKTHRQHRIRFCCFSRQELNNWLTVLRDAADVVFNLEQTGSIPRSVFRRRLEPNVMSSLLHMQPGIGGRFSLKQYRKRIQLEDDLAALEAAKITAEQALKDKARDAHSPREASPQRRSQSPPAAVFK